MILFTNGQFKPTQSFILRRIFLITHPTPLFLEGVSYAIKLTPRVSPLN